MDTNKKKKKILFFIVGTIFRKQINHNEVINWWASACGGDANQGFKTVRAGSCTTDIVAGIKFGLIKQNHMISVKICKQKSPIITLFELNESVLSSQNKIN